MAEPHEWVTPSVPCFAVVGKVNMGKSAVLATLLEEDDDRIIRISPEPGETTRCQRLSLVLDGVERLRFIDTPGFQQPIEALRAIRALNEDARTAPGLATLRRFVEAYRGTLPGTDREVDFLRFGRVALVYQTLDQTEVGMWNPQTEEWEQLPREYVGQITQGIRIAREQAAPDLIRLPITTAEAAE